MWRSLTLLCSALLLLLLLPLPAWGAAVCASEGAVCSSYTSTLKGNYRDECVCLCNGNHAANEDCSELNLSASDLGWPSFYTLVIHLETGCSGVPTVTPKGLTHTADAEFALVGTAMSTTTIGSKDFLLSHPIVKADIANGAGCTDLEVLLILWHLQ